MSFHPEVGSGAPEALRPTAPRAELGHTALLCATEPLDLLGGTHLQERAQPLFHNSRCLVVDLQRADYIDSAGVRALLRIAEALENQDKELRLVIVEGSRVERTLNLLLLTSRFRVFHRLDDAWTGRTAAEAPIQ